MEPNGGSFAVTESSRDDLERLRQRHGEMDRRIRALEAQVSMTSEEQFERARLKKEKLAAKDQIARLEARASGRP